MNIIVCDDEKTFLNDFQVKLKSIIDSKDKIFVYNSITKLEEEINKKNIPIDIIYMDIKIGKLNGIEFIKNNKEIFQKTKIIYISGYDEYYEDVFETEPIYFLRKPITLDKIRKSYNKVKALEEKENKYVILKTSKKLEKVLISNINFLESNGRIINIYLDDNVISLYGKLQEMEDLFPNTFVRTHKSYLVNMDKIKIYNKDKIILLSGREIPISRTYLKSCKLAIFEYLEESYE